MLDVHPAHHAATTWRDFFIHIATIVLGLIIAVGLEQAVEYIHHRREAREARENIQDELRINLGIVQRNQKNVEETMQRLTHNIDLLDSGASDAQIIPQLETGYRKTRTLDGSWNAAKISGALALIPPREIHAATYFYESTESMGPIVIAYFNDMDTLAAQIDHARLTGKLSPAERQLIFSLSASGMGRGRSLDTMYGFEIQALQSALN